VVAVAGQQSPLAREPTLDFGQVLVKQQIQEKSQQQDRKWCATT
jgi:hypothetical protein